MTNWMEGKITENEIILKKVLIVLFSFIVSVVISCLYILNFASGGESWGFYRLWSDQGFPSDPLSIFFLIVIGFLFGIFLTYILKVIKLRKIIKINLFTSILAVVFYILITLLINWSDFASEGQHYAWSGLMGYFGDFLFLAIVLFVYYGIFLIIGFLIGGITLYIKKRLHGNDEDE